jgi:hypothetical protein
MKAILRHGNYKLQWFEWTMLLLSFGIIVEAIRYADIGLMNSGQPAGAGHHLEMIASTNEKTQMMVPAPWRQLAEEAMLVELTMQENGRHKRDWTALGIPADEIAFFEFWQNNLDTALLDADGRLGRLLEARDLYQSVGKLMQQQMEQDAFFIRMQRLYRIPVDNARMHFYQQRPTTAGQWATFVAQHQGESERVRE